MSFELLESLLADCPTRTTVVGLAGLPFTGKTTLAERWVSTIPGVHVPTEAAILDRGQREIDGINGCDAAAYDIGFLREIMLELRAGRIIEVPRYEWRRGCAVGSQDMSVTPGGLVVLDGSVACDPRLAGLVDRLAFVIPAYDGWLDDAVSRDVSVRFWSRADALRLNDDKLLTAVDQFRASRDRLDAVYAWHGRGTRHEQIGIESAASLVERLLVRSA